MSRTLALAEFLRSYTPSSDETHAATRCLIDWMGCALAGSVEAPARKVVVAQTALEEHGQCTVIGRGIGLSPLGAALANGAAAHVLDFDDVNVASQIHPGAVIVPAVLASAELLERSGESPTGQDVLRAICVGYEAAERIGPLVLPTHYELGWHTTATLGCAAAAAAAGSLQGLSRGGLARAISLGLTQAGGLRGVFGSDGKCFHAGRSAAAGLSASMLAASGFNVPEDLLDGPEGYVTLTTGEARTDAIDVGGSPAIVKTAFKAHAACGATHSLADAVHGLVAENGLGPGDIDSIEAEVHTLAMHAAGQREPRSELEAKFSLWHVAAMAVYEYPLLPHMFRDGGFEDPRFVELRDQIRVEANPTFEYREAMPARVVMHTTSGHRHERFVDTPLGRPSNPMTDDQLSKKFLGLATARLSPSVADELIESLWNFRHSSSGMAEVLGATRPAADELD